MEPVSQAVSDERKGQERDGLSGFCRWGIPSPLVGELFQFASNNILLNRLMQSRIPSYDPPCFETSQNGRFILQTILNGERHSQPPEKLYWREKEEVSAEDRSRGLRRDQRTIRSVAQVAIATSSEKTRAEYTVWLPDLFRMAGTELCRVR
jgi:hypothetical protein